MEKEQVEKFRDFNEDVRRRSGLVIARVPQHTRAQFLEIAEKYFADDYGMLLKFLIDSYMDFEVMRTNQDIKLNYIIQLIEQKSIERREEPEEKAKGIVTLSGKALQGRKE